MAEELGGYELFLLLCVNSEAAFVCRLRHIRHNKDVPIQRFLQM